MSDEDDDYMSDKLLAKMYNYFMFITRTEVKTED